MSNRIDETRPPHEVIPQVHPGEDWVFVIPVGHPFIAGQLSGGEDSMRNDVTHPPGSDGVRALLEEFRRERPPAAGPCKFCGGAGVAELSD